MKDYIEIGASPSDEDCAQVGQNNFFEQASRECGAFIKQLIRVFGTPPHGCYLHMMGFPHDFGTYYEVVCDFDTEVEGSIEYAFKLESETPARWDEEAVKDLRVAD